jgi:hypothetical protein
MVGSSLALTNVAAEIEIVMKYPIPMHKKRLF